MGMRGLIIFDFNRTLYDPEKHSLTEGVKELLDDYSKKYNLAIIGKSSEKRGSLLSDLGIKKYFRCIILKEEKEENDFLQCLKECNASKEHVWSIGDRIKKEIAISNRLGLKTIWFKSGKFSSEAPDTEAEEPNFTVTSFKDIRKIIPL